MYILSIYSNAHLLYRHIETQSERQNERAMCGPSGGTQYAKRNWKPNIYLCGTTTQRPPHHRDVFTTSMLAAHKYYHMFYTCVSCLLTRKTRG